jgi:predicted RNA-binding protein
MCEADAYLYRDGQEELVLKSVDIVNPQPDGSFMLVDIFGTQKVIEGKLKKMELVDHKVIFEQ